MTALTIGAARKHLNITVVDHDDELLEVIAAAEAVIAQLVGPLEPTTVTSTATATSQGLLLPVTPVLSLTSIESTATGASWLAGATLNSETGLVTRTNNAWGTSSYTIVYQAGRTTCPPDLLLAVKELVRHLWESQRGPARYPAAPAGEGLGSPAGSTYLMPYRVQELIAPHLRMAVG